MLGQNGSGSNGNEGLLHIPQRSTITENSSSDDLVSYPGHSLRKSYPSAEIQSVYSTAPANWAIKSGRLEKKLDGNYTRMLRATLNKSWRKHPTRHKLYGHLPPITKTIQVRRTRHEGRSRDKFISDVLQWTPTYGRAKAGRPARTYIQQLCEDTGCSPEDLPAAMSDREKCRERSGISVLAAWHGHDDDPIYPTPPLGQDMTQGQFSKRSLAGLNSEFSFS